MAALKLVDVRVYVKLPEAFVQNFTDEQLVVLSEELTDDLEDVIDAWEYGTVRRIEIERDIKLDLTIAID